MSIPLPRTGRFWFKLRINMLLSIPGVRRQGVGAEARTPAAGAAQGRRRRQQPRIPDPRPQEGGLTVVLAARR